MNRKKIKKLVVAIASLWMVWQVIDVAINIHSYCHLKEGDLVFQNSISDQSPMIFAAQLSPWTHCGVIVEKNGKKYVLEAVGPSKLTPWREWRRRGRFGYAITRRVKKGDVKIRYQRYTGQPYDLAFKFDNGRLYCSELIYEVYRREFDIQLAKPHKVSHYHFTWLPSIRKAMKRRGISRKQEAVAPADILNSKYCKRIW